VGRFKSFLCCALLLWSQYDPTGGEHAKKPVQRDQQQNLISQKIILLKVQKSFIPHFDGYIYLGFKGFFKDLGKQ